MDLLRHCPYARKGVEVSDAHEMTSACTHTGVEVSNAHEMTSASTLRLNSTKTFVDVNPILRNISSQIFNHTFKSFYDFGMRLNSISPELIEVTDTAYGDITHKLKFYARSKA